MIKSSSLQGFSLLSCRRKAMFQAAHSLIQATDFVPKYFDLCNKVLRLGLRLRSIGWQVMSVNLKRRIMDGKGQSSR